MNRHWGVRGLVASTASALAVAVIAGYAAPRRAGAEQDASAGGPLPRGVMTSASHSDAWKIENALLAAPDFIAEKAAVMDWPLDPETGEGRLLRAGRNCSIDQAQTNGTSWAGDPDLWQSFTAGLTGSLTSIDLMLGSPLGPAEDSPATLWVYAGEGVGGKFLARQPVTLSGALVCGATNPGCWQSFTFTKPPRVVSGTKYSYRITVPRATTAFVMVNDSNPYPGGRASIRPSWDLLFVTHVCTEQ